MINDLKNFTDEELKKELEKREKRREVKLLDIERFVMEMNLIMGVVEII